VSHDAKIALNAIQIQTQIYQSGFCRRLAPLTEGVVTSLGSRKGRNRGLNGRKYPDHVSEHPSSSIPNANQQANKAHQNVGKIEFAIFVLMAPYHHLWHHTVPDQGSIWQNQASKMTDKVQSTLPSGPILQIRFFRQIHRALDSDQRLGLWIDGIGTSGLDICSFSLDHC
jgi:hypothetical protein